VSLISFMAKIMILVFIRFKFFRDILINMIFGFIFIVFLDSLVFILANFKRIQKTKFCGFSIFYIFLFLVIFWYILFLIFGT
jgi:hypothetical protein